jgi:hypothetical protein
MSKHAPTLAPQVSPSDRTTTRSCGIRVQSGVRAGFTPVPIPSPR